MLSRQALIALSRAAKPLNTEAARWIESKKNCDRFAVNCLGLEVNDLKSETTKYEQKLTRFGIAVLTIVDSSYPKRLLDFSDAPFALYVRGDAELLNSPKTFSIVGTRKCSAYGLSTTERFTKVLADNGFVIVSGLALGIDSCAHRSCVEAGGKTIAVLGNAIDKIYPPQNEALSGRIIKSGGIIVSQYPPGFKTEKYLFVYRNRIIAALGDYLLVSEAPERSGALITAGYANDLGRDVYAVPADISRPSAMGTNKLIATGAYCATSEGDLLEALGIRTLQPKNICAKDQAIIDVIVNSDGSFDRILKCLEIDAVRLNIELMRLEIEGLVKKDILGKYYRI